MVVSCKGEYHVRFTLVSFCIGVHPLYDPRRCGEKKGIVYFKEKTDFFFFLNLVGLRGFWGCAC